MGTSRDRAGHARTSHQCLARAHGLSLGYRPGRGRTRERRGGGSWVQSLEPFRYGPSAWLSCDAPYVRSQARLIVRPSAVYVQNPWRGLKLVPCYHVNVFISDRDGQMAKEMSRTMECTGERSAYRRAQRTSWPGLLLQYIPQGDSACLLGNRAGGSRYRRINELLRVIRRRMDVLWSACRTPFSLPRHLPGPKLDSFVAHQT